MDESYIKEKFLQNYCNSISIEQMEIFIEQMKTKIFRIKCRDGGYGTGFFCFIPFPDKLNLLPVLITNSHVLEKQDILPGNVIECSLNNGKKYKIFIDQHRKTYINEKPYDITIIEIRINNDGLNKNLFLEIDDDIFKNNSNELYKGKSVYLLHYPFGSNIVFSSGVIKGIYENNYRIEHLCQSEKGSSGSPILNLFNFKVLGIHIGAKEGKNWNLGTFMKQPLEIFYQTFYNNNNYMAQLYFNQQSNYKIMHRTGIKKIDQSSSLNATIQCLSNINELSSSLLKKYEKQDFNMDTQPLIVAFSSLLFELFNTKDKYIVPSLFKEIIGKLNPLFKGFHIATPKDLIAFFIEKLHEELNMPQQSQNQNHQIDYYQQEIESRNEQLMLKKFIIDFNTKNISVISNNFYGINQSIMKCEKCGVTKHSFKEFYLLIFQLKKVKEQKKKELGDYYNYYHKTLNIYDAFEVEQKEEELKGENMIYCNNCRKLTNGKHQTKIFGLPEILIIVLNRGENNKDFNEEFEIYEKLDFNNRNLITNQDSYKKYYLCGVITLLGEIGDGHYIAYCRNDPNGQFICYNDSIVSDVSIEVATSSKKSDNDFEKKTPYILFYHHY